MHFGDKQTFAIDLELDNNYGGSWLFGKFFYWINGTQVGDYELGTSLRDVLFQMKYVVFDCGNRSGGILCQMSPQEIFSKLDAALYGEGELTAEHYLDLPDQPARFDIRIPVDVFDGWKIYLLDCDHQAIIFFKHIDGEGVNTTTIPMTTFDKVINDVYDYLNQLYEKVIIRQGPSPHR